LRYPEIRLAKPARVLELAYRGALKALAPMGHVGSNPTPGMRAHFVRARLRIADCGLQG
jgi:hypothetical protein